MSIRPTWLASSSVNQRFPSPPVVMNVGNCSVLCVENSVKCPVTVTRPIWSTFSSVNQSAPSGPDVIPHGWLSGVGTAYSASS